MRRKGRLSGSGLHLNGEVGHSGTRRVFEDGAHRSLRWGASSRGRALMMDKVWGPLSRR